MRNVRILSVLVSWFLSTGVSAETSHWAFDAVRDPRAPNVEDAAWPRDGLDRFILARLEADELRPNDDASKRVWLRRVTFDLIGLPPTSRETREFLSDASPEARERVVDRLLSSPRYGERQGRQWLDVARYADSNGLDENIAHGNAWRYRDWTIEAFNVDLPYDQFVRAQIAGDLIAAEVAEASSADRHRLLTATGFLSLGPKVLAEGDVAKLEMDIIDEQLDSLGRALLGLTIGCARCHDHKYDPLSTEDYYRLAGVFKSTKTMESLNRIARWHENSVATPADHAAKAAHGAKVAKLKAEIAALQKDAARKKELESRQAKLKELERAVPMLGTAMGVVEGKPQDLAVHIRGDHLRLGKSVERGVPTFLEVPGAPSLDRKKSGRRELADWIATPRNPLTARVIVNRVWRWHFGTGLVGTPDNFGRRGDEPSHPDLLDWLTSRFVEEAWSIKALRRRIVLSRTYGMSSQLESGDARLVRALEIDPENQLLWRAPTRRLDAEQLRDAFLAVAGDLDASIGGRTLTHVRNREFLFDHTSRDGTSYDTKRRSVYLPVIRNHVCDSLTLFDFPDPAVVDGDRSTTTTAPQALFLLNNPWVAQVADRVAVEVAAAASTHESAVESLFDVVLGRPPHAHERRGAVGFLERFGVAKPVVGEASLNRKAPPSTPPPSSVQIALSALCQTILVSNDFVYLR